MLAFGRHGRHDLIGLRRTAVLNISRGSLYYKPRPVSAADLAQMRRMDELHLEFPFTGARMLQGLLPAEGSKVGRRHVKTLMRRMGMEVAAERCDPVSAYSIGTHCRAASLRVA